MGGFQPGMLNTTRAGIWVCITSIKLCAKCLTTANIPYYIIYSFVTLLEKQSSRCLALVRRGNGEMLIWLLLLFAATNKHSFSQQSLFMAYDTPLHIHTETYIFCMYTLFSLAASLTAETEDVMYNKLALRSDDKCGACDRTLSSKHTLSVPCGNRLSASAEWRKTHKHEVNPPLCQVTWMRWQWQCRLFLRRCRTYSGTACLATVWRCCSAARRYPWRGHRRQTPSLSSPWFLEETVKDRAELFLMQSMRQRKLNTEHYFYRRYCRRSNTFMYWCQIMRTWKLSK